MAEFQVVDWLAKQMAVDPSSVALFSLYKGPSLRAYYRAAGQSVLVILKATPDPEKPAEFIWSVRARHNTGARMVIGETVSKERPVLSPGNE